MSAHLNRPPIVLVPACQRVLGRHPFHVAGRKYVEAVRLAGCVPLVVPAAHVDELGTLLDIANGVLLTARRRMCIPAISAKTCTTPPCRSIPTATPGHCL